MSRAYVAIALVVALAGCTGPSASELPPSPASQPTALPIVSDVVTIVDHDVDLVGVEHDEFCRSGGGPELQRIDGALIRSGTDHLAIHVEVAPTYTSLQVGYSIDDGDTTWLEPVAGGDRGEFTIPVPLEMTEKSEPRWRFAYQLNLPVAPQECYTGAGSGHRSILIEAVPAPG